MAAKKQKDVLENKTTIRMDGGTAKIVTPQPMIRSMVMKEDLKLPVSTNYVLT